MDFTKSKASLARWSKLLITWACGSSLTWWLTAFVCTFACSSPSACLTSPSGLVSWWKGETNALDSVGTNHGALQNGVGFLPGEVGESFSLDGVDDYILVNASA